MMYAYDVYSTNNEIRPDISLPKVYLTNEQGVLLSNLKNVNSC